MCWEIDAAVHMTVRAQAIGTVGRNSLNRSRNETVVALLKAAADSAGATPQLSDADRGWSRGGRRAYASSQW